MLKLIVKFPQMEKAMDAVPYFVEGTLDCNPDWKPNWDKWYDAQHVAMAQLEEAAFALAMERVRKKTGTAGYYSGHIGLWARHSCNKRGFEIDADLLYPELIAVLYDLQKLGAFEMHFEQDNGDVVADDWWRDDELVLYDPFASTNYDFDNKLIEADTAKRATA